MAKVMIEVKKYTKVIKNQTVLSEIDMKFEAGKIYGIVGHNGSGKTMLFRSICGFVKPTKGEIKVKEQHVGKDAIFPDDVGILIETPGFMPNKTGLENLKYLADINKRIDMEQIRKTLTRVGLNPDDKKKMKSYSLGMRQRLGIAQAIMEEPQILILDEPMNALDKDGVALVKDILLEYKAKGCTILLASHNDADIHSLCDYVYHLQNGILMQEQEITPKK